MLRHALPGRGVHAEHEGSQRGVCVCAQGFFGVLGILGKLDFFSLDLFVLSGKLHALMKCLCVGSKSSAAQIKSKSIWCMFCLFQRIQTILRGFMPIIKSSSCPKRAIRRYS